MSSGNKSIENLTIVQGHESASVEGVILEQLVGARAWIMIAKA